METSDSFGYYYLQLYHMDDHLRLPKNDNKIMLNNAILNPTLIT